LGNNKRVDRSEPFDRLLAAADADTLRRLVHCLANTPQMRRTCLEFLRERQSEETVSPAETDAEIVHALWDELQPDLEELDDYGGGDYDTADHVDDLLYELSGMLTQTNVPVDTRRELLDEVMPYIRSGNSGLVDSLYDVAYSTCKHDDDWRDLAERLEATGQDWPCDHARRVWVDVLKKPAEWETFARKIKLVNARRPAFQQEFSKAVPGWNDL